MATASSTHVFCPVLYQKQEGALFVSSDNLLFESDNGVLSKEFSLESLSRVTANKAGTSTKHLLRIDVKGEPSNKPHVMEFDNRETLDEAKEDCLGRMEGKGLLDVDVGVKQKPQETVVVSKENSTTAEAKTPSRKSKQLPATASRTGPTKSKPSNTQSKPTTTTEQQQPRKQQDEAKEENDDVTFIPTKIEEESPRRMVHTLEFTQNPNFDLPLDPNSYHSYTIVDDTPPQSPTSKQQQQQQQQQQDVTFTPTKMEEESPRRIIRTVKLDMGDAGYTNKNMNASASGIGVVPFGGNRDDDDDDDYDYDSFGGEDDDSTATPKHQITSRQRQQQQEEDVQFTPTKLEEQSPRRNLPKLDLKEIPMLDPNSQSNKSKQQQQQQSPLPLPFGGNSDNEDNDDVVDEDAFDSSDNSDALETTVSQRTDTAKAEPEMFAVRRSNAEPNSKQQQDDDEYNNNTKMEEAREVGALKDEQGEDEKGINPCTTAGCKLEYVLCAIGTVLCLILTPIILWIVIRGLHSGEKGGPSSLMLEQDEDEYYNIDHEGPLVNYRRYHHHYYLRRQ